MERLTEPDPEHVAARGLGTPVTMYRLRKGWPRRRQWLTDSTRGRDVADEQRLQRGELRPEARLGIELRRAREGRGVSLRALARKLIRSHSTLVEYERGHRLAPLDVIEAYEAELGVAPGMLVALHEQARLQL